MTMGDPFPIRWGFISTALGRHCRGGTKFLEQDSSLQGNEHYKEHITGVHRHLWMSNYDAQTP